MADEVSGIEADSLLRVSRGGAPSGDGRAYPCRSREHQARAFGLTPRAGAGQGRSRIGQLILDKADHPTSLLVQTASGTATRAGITCRKLYNQLLPVPAYLPPS